MVDACACVHACAQFSNQTLAELAKTCQNSIKLAEFSRIQLSWQNLAEFNQVGRICQNLIELAEFGRIQSSWQNSVEFLSSVSPRHSYCNWASLVI